MNFFPHQVFFYISSSYQIWDQNSDTRSFRFQVKSSQCWKWNLLYHKFWEVSRSLKVTPKKILALLLILFWKMQMAWRWNCNCGCRWKLSSTWAHFWPWTRWTGVRQLFIWRHRRVMEVYSPSFPPFPLHSSIRRG